MSCSQSSEDDNWRRREDMLIPYKRPSKQSSESHNSQVLLNGLSSWHREEVYKVLDQIRLAKEEEINNMRILERNKVRRELQEQFASKQRTIVECMGKLESECKDIRDLLKQKEQENNVLVQKLFNQEAMIASYRISEHSMYQSVNQSHNSPTPIPTPEPIIQSHQAIQTNPLIEKKPEKCHECSQLTQQIETLKKVCKAYEEETENAKVRYTSIYTKLKDLEQARNDEVVHAREEARRDAEMYKKIYEETKLELDSHKNNVENEAFVREVLNHKQQQVITAMQGELRTAKFFLQNPHTRYQVFNKLKQYVTHTQPNKPRRKSSVSTVKQKTSRNIFRKKSLDLTQDNCIVQAIIHERRGSETTRTNYKSAATINHNIHF